MAKNSSANPSKRKGVSNLVPGAGGGPQPGAGRPSSLVRQMARGAYAQRLPILEQLADGRHGASPRDRIAALKELREVGFPQKIELTGDEGGPIVSEVKLVIVDPAGDE